MNLAPHAQRICRHLLGEPNRDLSTATQWRYGTKGSLAVEVAGDDAGAWFDHEAQEGGGLLDLICREKGYSNGEAFAWLRDELDIKDEGGRGAQYRITGTWVYRDRDGEPLFRVVRRDAEGKPKKIHQERYDPATKSYTGKKGCMEGVRRVPYRLNEWHDRDHILIAEGERKVDALFDLGWLATCNPGGAGKFSKGFAPYFDGASVVILPDNDGPGRDHARQVAAILEPVAASVRILELPGLPAKGDVIDWLAAGGTADQLRELIDAAPPAAEVLARWQPDAEKPAAPGIQQQRGFKLTEHGVYQEVHDREGGAEWVWIASPIEVLAETRNAAGEAWGRLLRIPDRDGTEHTWAMPMRLLAGGGVEYRERLLELGAELAPGQKAHAALHTYLSVWRPPAKARCVERTGWHGKVFVLPDATYGETNGEPVLLQAPGTAPQYDLAGSLEGWQRKIGALAVGNSRLVLAISAAFAAPLLHLVCEESGGLHLHGSSSTGKTTIAEAAASVWGVPKRTWRMTTNAAESTSRGSCDALLFLDEIGQAEPWDIDAMAYLIGNEAGKGRMKRDATARETLTWRTLFLSTGEIGLLAKLTEIGRRPRAGQAMRLLEVPADAGAGLGVFEHLHGHRNGDALARHLKLAAKEHRGHAARAFVAKVAAEFEEVAETIAEIRRRWVEAHVGEEADGQVLRAAGRFALLAAAGELAQMWGVVPWPEGEADRAAQTCFEAWLGTRGGADPQEVIEGLAQVRKFLEEHGNDRFEHAWDVRTDKDGHEIKERVINRAGFRRLNDDGEWEYFLLPEAWRREVCAGFDHVGLARAMAARGWMQREGEHLTRKMRVPRHGLIRVYHVLPGALA